MIIARTLKVRIEISDHNYNDKNTQGMIKCLVKNKLNSIGKLSVKDIWFARK